MARGDKKIPVKNKPGIRKLGDKYYARAYVGRDAKGKAVYAEQSFDRLSDAEEFRAKKVLERNQGTFVKPTKETLASFCNTFLLEKEYQVRASTLRKYNWLLQKYVIGEPDKPCAIGKIELRKLRPSHFPDLYVKLTQPTEDGEQGLSLRSVKHLHVVLKQVLSEARIKGLVTVNVLQDVKPPRPIKVEMKTWKEHEIPIFLQASRKSRYHIAYNMAFGTGARIGEILGIQWRDVDWENGSISIQRSYTHAKKGYEFNPTKTYRANRPVKLGPSMLAELRRHWEQQQAERQKAGDLWEDNDLIVTTSLGKPVKPHNLRTTFNRIIDRTGLPKIRMHDMRHTHATILLQKGVNPKVVSERLGHASVSITLDTYSHVLQSLQEEAADKFDSVFAAAGAAFPSQVPYGQHMGNIL